MALRPLRALRSNVNAWRQPQLAARIARILIVVWAVIVWNVVFDHVIVVAGRNYIAAARTAAARRPGSGQASDRPFANMDDWMKPAVRRGVWIATAAGAAILAAGLGAVRR